MNLYLKNWTLRVFLEQSGPILKMWTFAREFLKPQLMELYASGPYSEKCEPLCMFFFLKSGHQPEKFGPLDVIFSKKCRTYKM